MEDRPFHKYRFHFTGLRYGLGCDVVTSGQTPCLAKNEAFRLLEQNRSQAMETPDIEQSIRWGNEVFYLQFQEDLGVCQTKPNASIS